MSVNWHLRRRAVQAESAHSAKRSQHMAYRQLPYPVTRRRMAPAGDRRVGLSKETCGRIHSGNIVKTFRQRLLIRQVDFVSLP